MKPGIEQAVYAIVLLHFLPNRAVLPGEAISQQLGTSRTYFQKILRKLVHADIISSVTGVKGGFKLRKEPEEIRLYDIYVAIEGKQPFYAPRGILDDLFDLEERSRCLLTDVMESAESAWQATLQQETIGSLIDDIEAEDFRGNVDNVRQWVDEHMVV